MKSCEFLPPSQTVFLACHDCLVSCQKSLANAGGMLTNGVAWFAGIKWEGILRVQFTVPVTPQVFHKVVYECKNYQLAPKRDSQEAGELVNDTETVTLDRDDIVKVFGAVRLQYLPGLVHETS
ncbi:hypothetical protein ABBQ32_004966 [Trebouxia sp. C0010 RCD-2024]